jgi:transcriptional regulator with XRE-family HTH domain
MNQPELGRKIAELRKAKGLTQDELVALCNLSVRTLQRIESGEVIPRSYTIKTIFSALDYNMYENNQPASDFLLSGEVEPNSWLEQIYRYVFDLFNLKTNTMKKLLILSSITICMVFLFTDLTRAESVNKTKLVGTWQLCDGNAKIATTGSVRIKLISDESFSVAEVDQDKSYFSGYFIGTYTLDNDVYTETITLTNPAMYKYKGVTNKFKIEFKGDLMYVSGIGNPYNEIWKKIKK